MFFYIIIIKPIFYNTRRNSSYNSVWWHILGYQCTSSNNRAPTDGNTFQNCYITSNPYTFFDYYVLVIFGQFLLMPYLVYMLTNNINTMIPPSNSHIWAYYNIVLYIDMRYVSHK